MQHDELKDWAMVGDTSAASEASDGTERILELERKLEALHVADVNALRRAHRTLGQHAQALRIESQHLTSAIKSFETDFVTVEFAAKEAGFLSAVLSGTYVVDRLISKAKFESPRKILFLLAIGIAGWRFFKATTDRLRRMSEKNKATKDRLMKDWKLCDQRIEIMNDLVSSTSF